MAEEKESNVKSTIEAVTGLVKAIPIYDDALQPAAKQIGKSLETVTKVVNIALVPLRGLVWGFDKIENWLNNRIAQKLENVPEENIITPPIEIAGPTIEALRYTTEDSGIRELYANLLASSMNKETIHKAHPGYIEIIKSITIDETYILKAFSTNSRYPAIDVLNEDPNTSGFVVLSRNVSMLNNLDALSRPDLTPSYIDNLCRLGLLEVPVGLQIAKDDSYDQLENLYSELKEGLANVKRILGFTRKIISVTSYGSQFIENVMNEIQ